MKRATLDELQRARREGRPVAHVTRLGEADAEAVVFRDGASGALALAPETLQAVRARLRDDASGTIEAAEGRLFVHVFNPALRLVIVGAVHIAQSLAPMAALAGFRVIVVDPRRSFATDARFPDVSLSTEWPDEALEALGPDSRMAVVTLTHDPKLDDPALEVALKSDAFYIGALGSKRTHAARLSRLRERGLNDAQLSRIHGPVGLDIGAVSPAEIALAVLGQITAVRHARLAA